MGEKCFTWNNEIKFKLNENSNIGFWKHDMSCKKLEVSY